MGSAQPADQTGAGSITVAGATACFSFWAGSFRWPFTAHAGLADYLRALLSWHTPDWSGKTIGIGLIVAVVVVNLIGTKFVGRSEIFVVTIELAILAVSWCSA